jgi:hypothetical protein
LFFLKKKKQTFGDLWRRESCKGCVVYQRFLLVHNDQSCFVLDCIESLVEILLKKKEGCKSCAKGQLEMDAALFFLGAYNVSIQVGPDFLCRIASKPFAR